MELKTSFPRSLFPELAFSDRRLGVSLLTLPQAVLLLPVPNPSLELFPPLGRAA